MLAWHVTELLVLAWHVMELLIDEWFDVPLARISVPDMRVNM